MLTSIYFFHKHFFKTRLYKSMYWFCLFMYWFYIIFVDDKSAGICTSLSPEKESGTYFFVAAANGDFAPPLITLPYSVVPDTMWENCPSEWRLTGSEWGWMSATDLYNYITEDFYNWLTRWKVELPVVLFVNAYTPISMQLVEFCKEAKIHFIFLPPDTTGFLQPLDVDYFRLFTREWKKHLLEWSLEHLGSKLGLVDFPPLFQKSLKSINKGVLPDGFKSAGLYPSGDDIGEAETSPFATEFSLDECLVLERFMEQHVSHEMLQEFQDCEPSTSWSGPVQYEQLYLLWLKMRMAKQSVSKVEPIVQATVDIKVRKLINLFAIYNGHKAQIINL